MTKSQKSIIYISGQCIGIIMEANKSNIDFLDDEFDEEEEDTLEDMYLVFDCRNKHYGIEIRYVTEIVAMQSITEVPDLPEYFKGLINLRGRVFPVMDVALRFNQPPAEYNERTCFVIASYENSILGLIVDGVEEVVKIPSSEVEPPPNMGDAYHNRFIQGMGKVDGEVRILLDIHNLIHDEETKNANSAVSDKNEPGFE